MSIQFTNNQIRITNNEPSVYIDYDNIDCIIVNDELKMDRIYLANNAIIFGGIENIIKHHENNITKVVGNYNGDKEHIIIKKGKLHSLSGPAYTHKDTKRFCIEGKEITEEEYYKIPEVIKNLRELKLLRVLKKPTK